MKLLFENEEIKNCFNYITMKIKRNFNEFESNDMDNIDWELENASINKFKNEIIEYFTKDGRCSKCD
jgi:hypothetical protein